MKFVTVLLLIITVPACFSDPVIDLTLTAPDGDITGLGFGEGHLWAVDQNSNYIYKLNPSNGDVVDSWLCSQVGSRTPTGLTCCSSYIFIAAAIAPNYTSAYCYRYSSSGTYLSSFDLDC
ncbi:MAG: hypothetical protein K8S15_00250 [Candidatus Aegiribacteria sp.]|nr:hypothetical protein [Candidatus Aegiribacteria sp.]